MLKLQLALRFLPAILILLMADVRFTAAQDSSIDSLQLKWEKYTLPNGLQVLLQPDQKQEEVSIELWVHAGTRHEWPGRFGMAHFFEHATPYGFRDDRAKKKKFLETLSGSNARTRPDFTYYYLQTTQDNLDLVLAYVADRLRANAEDIIEKNVERHRENVLTEMTEKAKYYWAPKASMADRAGIFGAHHPYGHGSYGTLHENEALSVDDLRRWFRAHFRPEYSTLFIVGRFDAEQSKLFIKQHFESIPGGERPPKEKPWPVKSRGGEASIVVRADEPTISVSWPVASWGSEDDAGLHLLAHVLDDRMKNDSDKPDLITYISATRRLELFQLAGIFSIVASYDDTAEGKAIVNWINEHVGKILTEGPTESELIRAREAERQAVRKSLDKPGWISSRTSLLGRGLLFKDNPDAYLERLEKQRHLTSPDIQEIAVRWLAHPQFVLYMTPLKEEEKKIE